MEYFLISVRHLPKRSCLKAKVPLIPVSQSIVSKYESNIFYLNGVNMFTRFRGVLELRLCTDCLPLKEQHLSTLTSLFFSSHSSILSIIQLYCHGGRECSWFPNIHLDWILSTNKQLDLISIHISFPDVTRSTGFYSLAVLSSHNLLPTRQPNHIHYISGWCSGV